MYKCAIMKVEKNKYEEFKKQVFMPSFYVRILGFNSMDLKYNIVMNSSYNVFEELVQDIPKYTIHEIDSFFLNKLKNKIEEKSKKITLYNVIYDEENYKYYESIDSILKSFKYLTVDREKEILVFVHIWDNEI